LQKEGRNQKESRQSLTGLGELGFSTKTGNVGLKEEKRKNMKREHLWNRNENLDFYGWVGGSGKYL